MRRAVVVRLHGGAVTELGAFLMGKLLREAVVLCRVCGEECVVAVGVKGTCVGLAGFLA